MKIHIGLDIGGTKILAASADSKGNIVERLKFETPEELGKGLLLLDNIIEALSKNHEILGIGAAIGGPLDSVQGIVSPLHLPEWRDVQLRRMIEDKWNTFFVVDVDTNIAALGEYSIMDPKPQSLYYMTVSTGIGGGLIIDGDIFRGGNGNHPEAGHQAIPFRCSHSEKIECECGAHGCLEALASGNGIRRIYNKPAEDLSETEWEEVQWNIAQGLRNVASFYSPEIIVLGGGVAYGRGQVLSDYIKNFLKEELKLISVPEIRISRLGYDTALIGALEAAKIAASL